MYKLVVIGISSLVGLALPVSAQNMQRRATMVGGGSPDRGKCTVEVVVDGAAEVEIRGDTATLRNLKGQMPEWRRFECTGVMPANPGDFRFAGVDGRGSQQLVRDPRNGGTAVVQIQDSDNGREGYTFDIFWGGQGAPRQDRNDSYNREPGNHEPGYREPAYGEPGYRDNRGGPARFSREDAMRSCQDAVRQQAAERFDARNITFRQLNANDNPGPRDSVNGIFDVQRRDGRNEAFRFSCSVNFDTGRVWNAVIEPFRADRGEYRGGNPQDRAIHSCQRAVEDRIATDGFGNIRIESIRIDDRPGRGDRVFGNARADSRRGSAAFSFSCSVDLRDGDVRNVDVRQR